MGINILQIFSIQFEKNEANCEAYAREETQLFLLEYLFVSSITATPSASTCRVNLHLHAFIVLNLDLDYLESWDNF